MNGLNARAVSALGLAGIVVTFVVLLAHSAPRRSGTDLTPNGAFVAFLHAGQQACQGQELLPADTSAVRMTIGTYGRPGPPVRVAWSQQGGRPIALGELGSGWQQGVVTIPVRHVSQPSDGLRVCLTNGGPQVIALAGTKPDSGYSVDVAGGTIAGRLRFDYLRPGRESWFELLPTLVYRSTIGKAGLVRHWAWAGAVVLMLLAAALAIATITREARQ
jgi:hypothetical protein